MVLQLIIRALMIVSLLNLLWVNVTFAEKNSVNRTPKSGITNNAPEFISTPVEGITPSAVKKEKGSKWLYYVLGGLIAGGAVLGASRSGPPCGCECSNSCPGSITINGPAP